ncbi:MAG: type II CAAX endopeptidase family protein [Elainellaceae cyanobacterium]
MKLRLASVSRYPAPVRILLFLVVLALFWLPIAAPIALLIENANTVTILTMSLLFIGFLIWIRIWGRRVHQEPQIFRAYGLYVSRSNAVEWLVGFSLGAVWLFSLFLVQSSLGWVVWQPVPNQLLRLLLEGLLSAMGVGLAEGLVFRGWLLDELARDYRPAVSLGANSLLYAGLHFLKPLPEMIRTFPQFPGLVLLGLALVWAKRSTQGRLGLSIGLHSGLVFGYYMVNVGEWVSYNPLIPEWLTGIDRNPLAGAVGLLFLLGMAGLMYWRSQRFARN